MEDPTGRYRIKTELGKGGMGVARNESSVAGFKPTILDCPHGS